MTTTANDTTVIPVAVTGAEVFIPLNKLKKHPNNARKTPHGGLTLEQLMAFAIVDDPARQEQVYENLSWNKDPSTIRRDLTRMHIAATDRRAIFVGAESYYEDARFKERLLPPPDLSAQPKASKLPSGDDWSALTIPTPVASSAAPSPDAATDPANAGIRREPELPEHEEIVPDASPVAGEFDVLDDEPDVDAAKSRTMRQQVTSIARQATMDPADGIDL